MAETHPLLYRQVEFYFIFEIKLDDKNLCAGDVVSVVLQ
jgi:hypothetical protein